MEPSWMEQHSSYLGDMNRLWNMLCLTEHLQELWARGCCAFKGIEIRPVSRHESVIILEFHWMPQQTSVKPLLHANVEGKCNDWTKMAKTMSQLNASKLPAADTYSGLPIESGKRIDIRMGRREALQFKGMIDLQWACITVASLSGAVSPGLLHQYEPYLWIHDTTRKAKILSWLEDID
ncbi:hypothetical protein ACHAPT_007092 [Fusarium lateritium]